MNEIFSPIYMNYISRQKNGFFGNFVNTRKYGFIGWKYFDKFWQLFRPGEKNTTVSVFLRTKQENGNPRKAIANFSKIVAIVGSVNII